MNGKGNCRRGFERLLRKLLRLKNSPAVLVVHWWSPLHFLSSYWNVAEDELDVIASYYRLQVTPPCTAGTLLTCRATGCLIFPSMPIVKQHGQPEENIDSGVIILLCMLNHYW